MAGDEINQIFDKKFHSCLGDYTWIKSTSKTGIGNKQEENCIG